MEAVECEKSVSGDRQEYENQVLDVGFAVE